MVSDQISCF